MSEITHDKRPWATSNEKRMYDILGASGVAVLAAPAIAISALAVYLQDRQNPFFVQQPLGRGSQPFRIYKIRSLEGTADYHTSGRGPEDSRATPIGRFLRRYAIDELPQLLNIIKGDMSFVGPRPITPEDNRSLQNNLPDDQYQEWEAAYSSRRPGYISSFGIATRCTTGSERQKLEHHQLRAALDIRDTHTASRRGDISLGVSACKKAVSIIRQA